MWVIKTGDLISDTQKQALDFVDKLYEKCGNEDSAFLEYMQHYHQMSYEEVENILSKIKFMRE